jgi:hypothetical protein
VRILSSLLSTLPLIRFILFSSLKPPVNLGSDEELPIKDRDFHYEDEDIEQVGAVRGRIWTMNPVRCRRRARVLSSDDASVSWCWIPEGAALLLNGKTASSVKRSIFMPPRQEGDDPNSGCRV